MLHISFLKGIAVLLFNYSQFILDNSLPLFSLLLLFLLSVTQALLAERSHILQNKVAFINIDLIPLGSLLYVSKIAEILSVMFLVLVAPWLCSSFCKGNWIFYVWISVRVTMWTELRRCVLRVSSYQRNVGQYQKILPHKMHILVYDIYIPCIEWRDKHNDKDT